MKKNWLIKIYQHYLSSKLMLFAVVSLLIASFLTSHHPAAKVLNEKTIAVSTPIPTATPTTKIPSASPAKLVALSNPTPNPTFQPTATPSPIQTTPTPTASSQPTTQTTPTPTTNAVNLQINEPDGNFSYSIPFKDGENLCDYLTDAKNMGKIRSLSMSWYQVYNSYYVVEINGYSNNWTFTFNGAHPDHGCSFYKPSSSDSVVWKFG